MDIKRHYEVQTVIVEGNRTVEVKTVREPLQRSYNAFAKFAEDKSDMVASSHSVDLEEAKRGAIFNLLEYEKIKENI